MSIIILQDKRPKYEWFVLARWDEEGRGWTMSIDTGEPRGWRREPLLDFSNGTGPDNKEDADVLFDYDAG